MNNPSPVSVPHFSYDQWEDDESILRCDGHTLGTIRTSVAPAMVRFLNETISSISTIVLNKNQVQEPVQEQE